MAKIIRLDGIEMEPQGPHLVTRRNPFVNSGPYYEGILLDAAMSTRDYRNGSMVEILLNPSEITRPDAPYEQRILVPWRMIKLVKEEFGSEYVDIDGWVSDVGSGYILNFETTPYVRIIYDAGDKWELLMNTSKPENSIAFEASRDDELGALFRRHKTGNDIFECDCIDLLSRVYKQWKFPIIGVTEVTILDSFNRNKYVISPAGERVLNLKDEERFCIGDRPYFRLDENGEPIKEKPLVIISP